MCIDWNSPYSWAFIVAIALIAAYLAIRKFLRVLKNSEMDKFVPDIEKCDVRIQRKFGDGLIIFIAIVAVRNASGRRDYLNLEDQFAATHAKSRSCMLPTASRNLIISLIRNSGYGRVWKYEDFQKIVSSLESGLSKAYQTVYAHEFDSAMEALQETVERGSNLLPKVKATSKKMLTESSFEVGFSLEFSETPALEFNAVFLYSQQSGLYEMRPEARKALGKILQEKLPTVENVETLLVELLWVINIKATDRILEPYREGVGGHG